MYNDITKRVIGKEISETNTMNGIDKIDIDTRVKPGEYYNGTKLYSTLEERLSRINTEYWKDSPMDFRVPCSQFKDKYDIDSIRYENGIVDFSEIAKHTCEIPHMTENRTIDRIDADTGEIIKSNFSQYDEKMSKILENDGFTLRTVWIDPNGKEYKNWFDKDGIEYTRHELNDMKHMQLVPTEVHGVILHLGGCAECKRRDREVKFDV